MGASAVCYLRRAVLGSPLEALGDHVCGKAAVSCSKSEFAKEHMHGFGWRGSVRERRAKLR